MAKKDLRLETMKKWLETMDFYIDAGRSLNDKDRNNNFDLIEIYKFFRPIDKLFGDYEVRKRQGIEDFLYRKDTTGKIVSIDRDDIRAFTTNGYLLLLIVCQDTTSRDLRVNYGWIKIDRLMTGKPATIIYDKSAETALTVDPKTVKHIYVLEPTKLNRAIDLDEARYKSFQNSLLEQIIADFYNPAESAARTVLYHQIDRHVKSLQDGKDPALGKGDDKRILDAFTEQKEAIKPLVKLKNFRRYENVKLRLGQYKDGRYVIYLHPYWSESDCPVRIPSE